MTQFKTETIGLTRTLVVNDFSKEISMFKRYCEFTRRWRQALLLVALLLTSGCGGPPQVVDNEECFAAVDALWTAVTSKRNDLVEQTASELRRLHNSGSLSDAGHENLLEIVQMARKTEWKPAAEALKEFMLGQRKTR